MQREKTNTTGWNSVSTIIWHKDSKIPKSVDCLRHDSKSTNAATTMQLLDRLANRLQNTAASLKLNSYIPNSLSRVLIPRILQTQSLYARWIQPSWYKERINLKTTKQALIRSLQNDMQLIHFELHIGFRTKHTTSMQNNYNKCTSKHEFKSAIIHIPSTDEIILESIILKPNSSSDKNQKCLKNLLPLTN